jgi:hypothetical protein
MRHSPPEQGRSPLASTVMAASQSMAAIGVPSLVPVMNLLVKSSPSLSNSCETRDLEILLRQSRARRDHRDSDDDPSGPGGYHRA